MATAITRDQIIAALDEIGAESARNGITLEMAIYGGSALVLASNFRFSSEDVDISEVTRPWPAWFEDTVQRIADRNDWAPDWLNDAVQFHLSPAATEVDHFLQGSYPRGAGVTHGLRVFVPTPEYLLALKLKAFRIGAGGQKSDVTDILNLLTVLGLATPAAAIDVLHKYFPRSARDSEKQQFLLKQIWNQDRHHAPRYPG